MCVHEVADNQRKELLLIVQFDQLFRVKVNQMSQESLNHLDLYLVLTSLQLQEESVKVKRLLSLSKDSRLLDLEGIGILGLFAIVLLLLLFN